MIKINDTTLQIIHTLVYFWRRVNYFRNFGVEWHLLKIGCKKFSLIKHRGASVSYPFNLHIRKTDEWARKKFTTTVKVMEYTILTILLSRWNISLNDPKGPLVNAKHILYIKLNTKTQMASFFFKESKRLRVMYNFSNM